MVFQVLRELQEFREQTGKMVIRGIREYEGLWDPEGRGDCQDLEEEPAKMEDMAMLALLGFVHGKLPVPVL